jgi:hypothetical protein
LNDPENAGLEKPTPKERKNPMSNVIHGKLTWRGNVLCFVHTDTHYSHPLETTNLWKLETWPEADPKYEGMETRSYHGAWIGGWEVTIPCGASSRGIVIPGNRKPDESTTREVPPPKVRKGTEIRWQFGKWEKLLKTRGWVRV